MPNDKAFEDFIDFADRLNVEHLPEQDPRWNRFVKSWEKRGQDIVNSFLHRRTAKPGNVAEPSTAQTAFLTPKDETPLYSVSTADRKPFWETTKRFLSKDVDYCIEDWNLRMRLDKGDTKYDFLAGEKMELRTKFKQNDWTQGQINLGYNVRSGKARAKYSINTPTFGATAEVFTKGKNTGGVLSYSNYQQNWSAAISADRYNVAANFNFYKKDITPDYNIKVGGFANYSYEKRNERVIGLSCRFVYTGH